MRQFRVSTDIRFGPGSLASLRQLAGRRVLIVTDAFMAAAPLMDKVLAELRESTVTVFDQVSPNPDVATVAAGVSAYLGAVPDAVVALGGGSPIDAAKAVYSIAKRQGDSLAGGFIVIPTTSGSGSEGTSYAVISDPGSHSKVPLTSDDMVPDVAILDPEAVRSAPPGLTADAGMDAVSHAIEAYVATGHSDFSDAFAEKALQLLCVNLPQAHARPDDLAARQRVHNAACMAGLAFENAGLGIVHSLSHAIGGLFPLPHGRLNSIILPHVIEFNAGRLGFGPTGLTEVGQRYAHLGLVVDVTASTPRGRVLGLIEDCRALARRLHLPDRLSEAGVPKDDYLRALPQLAQAALADRCTAGNPVPVTVKDLSTLLAQIA
ncbi:MAG: iron-containing alcohol dehydrogenase [Propionibacteriaceae bacterium]|jgi:alcohol dehydrogenase class IV|nr:iron-containing alcohol dehydrogenase [Propionibacteriaceae bacterium]